MELTSDLLKEFSGLVNYRTDESDSKKHTTAYGTAVVIEDVKYVQIDGSDSLTPVAEATEACDGDRVLIEVKNHKATVIGNFTAPPSLRDSQEASDKAEQAIKDLEEAKDAAEDAKNAAEDASQKAQEAIDKALESQNASEQAQILIGEANTQIDNLREEIQNVKVDTDEIRDTVKSELPAIIDEVVSAEYAKKTDLVEVKGELEGSISMTAGELKTEMSEHYVTQSELVKIEEHLNTKINQNSEEIILSAYKTSELETDTEEIKALLRAAREKVREASETALEAKDLANAAERELIKAEGSLTIAQDNLQEALDYYNTVTNKDDATQEEIDDAQNRVREAELAVDQARYDVEAAQTAADKALADAKAAEEAYEQAKLELEDVVSQVSEMRAQIQVEADAVKIQVIENTVRESIDEDYYDKEETKALIEASKDGITLEVTNKVETNLKDEFATKEDLENAALDSVEIGGRNMCLDTSSEWTEFVLGADYTTIMRFNMTELVEKYGLADGDTLTYSIQLKSNSGKRLAAAWQKYNDSVDREGGTSNDTIVASNGRLHTNPVIDLSYEFLDLMVSNLSENLTNDTTEYYRCLKLENGNVPTDWSPAPEDTNDSIGSVQDNVNETDNRIDGVDQTVIEIKTKVELLEGMIKMLITDADGNSLMTQTSTGWTFDISGIEKNLGGATDKLNDLTAIVAELSNTTGGLESAVANLEETSEYVWITTYGDQPCLVLGESDSNYGLYITNTEIIFVDGSGNPTYISKDGLFANKLTVGSELRQKDFIWSVRQNGNLGLMWRQLKVVGINASYNGGTVYVGTAFKDLTGLVVKVEYSDQTVGRTTDYTVDDGTIIEGSNIITVHCNGLTTTLTVTGVAKEANLTKITVSYSGGRVVIGTPLNELTGISVVAYYDNNTSVSNVTGYTLSGNIVEGNNVITVTYNGCTTTFNVTGYASDGEVTYGDTRVTTIVSWSGSETSTYKTVTYGDSFVVENDVIVIQNVNTNTLYKTTSSNYSSNNYSKLCGKYVMIGNSCYYILPNSTYAHTAPNNTYTSELIEYNSVQKVTVNSNATNVVTISSIKATYNGGNVLAGTSVNSLTGVTVSATYSDGSTKNVTAYSLKGTISDGSNTITVIYGIYSTTFTVVGYVQTGSGELTMRNGTVTDNTTINTGLSKITQITVYRKTNASVGMVDMVYDTASGLKFSYCSSYSSGIAGGNIVSTTSTSSYLTVNGGSFTWNTTTANYMMASGVEYVWIAIGES